MTRFRRGYAAAIVVAAVGMLAGGLLWFGLPVGGDLGQRFDAGRPVTVHLDDARLAMIWTSDAAAQPRCDVERVDGTGPSGVELISQPDQAVDLDADGRTWRGTTLVRAQPAGAHRLTCDTAGAVGEPPWGYGAKARALTAITAFSLAVAGALAGGIIALRTAARRGTATSR
ncbi:hypothetical protein O7635_31690 [Asanoa sp. WMMD1127]|uniref:hypothetical protein n=1 Tax=Asanoa sp. WMMD1127 TaxID=3016107 RepID=UPI002415AB3A|nr:hypothetical protein [Asanoa sp. WMMD1127]MDG4826436.1 hypothetical protein [Asanoa sp. WMMD1127]